MDLTYLFRPTAADDSDILCEPLLRGYEVFMLAFLLGKYFDNVWQFDPVKQKKYPALYMDDKTFFDAFEALNKVPREEINARVQSFYQRLCLTYHEA